MKKMITSLTFGLLLVGGNSYAADEQEIVDPTSDLYDTTRLMEDAEYELTEDNGEKALLQDEYADKRLNEAELLLEEGEEQQAEELMEDYNEHIQKIEENIVAAKEAGEDISNVEEIVVENSQKRSENLTALLEREDLPEDAKVGIAQALENQKNAEKKLTEALKNAELARENAEEKQKEATKNAEKGESIAIEKQEESANKAEEAKSKGKAMKEENTVNEEEANKSKVENNNGKEVSEGIVPQTPNGDSTDPDSNNEVEEEVEEAEEVEESEQNHPDLSQPTEQKPEDANEGSSRRP